MNDYDGKGGSQTAENRSGPTMSVNEPPAKSRVTLEAATVRFCGDSGDGMQLAGMQLTNTSALAGNDVATFPDFPAEIRAPRGTKAGVSGYQIHFASRQIFTPGDRVDALVAMNPAALATNLSDLVPGGVLIVNSDAFGKRDLELAGHTSNPLEGDDLNGYQLFKVGMTSLTRAALKDLGLSTKEADRCRNFFAMGLAYWLYDRPLQTTERLINEKFGRRPDVAEANRRALHARRQPAHDAGNDAQATCAGRLVAGVEQHLHAHADTEERAPRRHRVEGRLLEAGGPQGVHARSERADTGQHHAVGGGDQFGVGGEVGGGADAFERLVCRVDVSNSVVEDRQPGARHSTPFVLGTPPGWSTRTASRNARASPLNVASMMWCTLRPRTSSTCRVIAAA